MIERRTSENVHFSRGLFSNGQSMLSGREIVTKGAESMVQDMIHFRVSCMFVSYYIYKIFTFKVIT